MNAEQKNELYHLGQALVESIDNLMEWNKEGAKTNPLVQRDSHDHELNLLGKKLVARKISSSSLRPPCVGVFGPSQAGKSYLVNTLTRPESGNLMVRFGSKNVDFLKDINPGGERESTGVVTRFTLSDPRVQDERYPVEARILSESELIKVLANSFFSDFNHQANQFRQDGHEIIPPDSETVRSRIKELEQLAGSDLQPGLQPEDVLDIGNYLKNSFKKGVEFLNCGGQDFFWEYAIRLAPRLTANQRARMFGLIWWDLPVFTSLYERLASALNQLSHPSECLLPVSALDGSDGQDSLVDAQLLSSLGDTNGSATVLPVVDMDKQSEVTIPKPMLAALVAELRLPLPKENVRWEFLSSLDVLDFPGARSRFNIEDLDKFQSDDSDISLEGQLLLRGKVGYFFERYTMDQELSSVLMCIPPGPLEVLEVITMVNKWVDTSFPNPEDRSEVDPALFFVMTKMDDSLGVKGGDTEEKERQRWEARLKSNLLEKTQSSDWIHDWDGRPFRNSFWLRNPFAKRVDFMEYEQPSSDSGPWKEIGVHPEHHERIERYKQFFINDETVKKHFEDPSVAWDAALSANDGGIGLIVEGLKPISNPQVHQKRLLKLVAGVCSGLSTIMNKYYDGEQGEEVSKKQQLYTSVKPSLLKLAQEFRMWNLLETLLPETDQLRELYQSVVTGADEESKSEDSLTTELAGDIDLNDWFMEQSGSSPSPTSGSGLNKTAVAYADRVVDTWASRIRACAQDEQIAKDLGMSPDYFASLVEELVTSAQRLDLKTTVAQGLDPSESSLGVTWETIMDRQVTLTRFLMGEYFGQLGLARVPINQRPNSPPNNSERHVFQPFSTSNGLAPLEENAKPMGTLGGLDWIIALEGLFVDNAGFQGEHSLSADLNDRLKVLINEIGEVKARERVLSGTD
jgi:hypothetical protein